MNWYKISQKIKGGNISVSSNNLWSNLDKLEETYQDLVEGRISYRGNSYSLPIVTKSLEMRGAIFVMDGHHRLIEDMIKGITRFEVYWEPLFPYMDAGIGNELPSDKIRLVDFLNSKDISKIKELI